MQAVTRRTDGMTATEKRLTRLHLYLTLAGLGAHVALKIAQQRNPLVRRQAEIIRGFTDHNRDLKEAVQVHAKAAESIHNHSQSRLKDLADSLYAANEMIERLTGENAQLEERRKKLYNRLVDMKEREELDIALIQLVDMKEREELDIALIQALGEQILPGTVVYTEYHGSWYHESGDVWVSVTNGRPDAEGRCGILGVRTMAYLNRPKDDPNVTEIEIPGAVTQ